MSLIGYFHFTAQYFTVSSHVILRENSCAWLLAGVHIYPGLFPLMSARPDKPSLMSRALGWDPRK